MNKTIKIGMTLIICGCISTAQDSTGLIDKHPDYKEQQRIRLDYEDSKAITNTNALNLKLAELQASWSKFMRIYNNRKETPNDSFGAFIRTYVAQILPSSIVKSPKQIIPLYWDNEAKKLQNLDFFNQILEEIEKDTAHIHEKPIIGLDFLNQKLEEIKLNQILEEIEKDTAHIQEKPIIGLDFLNQILEEIKKDTAHIHEKPIIGSADYNLWELAIRITYYLNKVKILHSGIFLGKKGLNLEDFI